MQNCLNFNIYFINFFKILTLKGLKIDFNFFTFGLFWPFCAAQQPLWEAYIIFLRFYPEIFSIKTEGKMGKNCFFKGLKAKILNKSIKHKLKIHPFPIVCCIYKKKKNESCVSYSIFHLVISDIEILMPKNGPSKNKSL